MATFSVPLLAIALLGLVTLTGWGVLRLLAPTGMRADAKLAFGPVVGLAAFSALAAVVVPALPAAISLGVLACTLLLGAAVGARQIGWLRHRPRAIGTAALAAVALVAVSCAALPFLLHSSGAAATWGNADPYLWVSQAKSLVSGAPPKPDTFFPDRVASEHLLGGGWAPGLPALIALVSIGTGQDPADAFGAVAALLYALAPFVAFAFGRVALRWPFRLSLIAALLVALSPFQLFASYYGWQPQLAGVACVLAAALAFRTALSVDEAAAARRWLFLTALLIAGALAIYRLPFVPYLAFVVVLVASGYVASNRVCLRAAARTMARRLSLLAALSILLAAPSALGLLLHAGTFWTRQSDITPWAKYVRALPSDALGLAPHLPDLTRSVPSGWRLVALLLALAILARGLKRLPGIRQSGGYPDLVAALTLGSLVSVAIVQLPQFTPYYSIKLMGYGTVPMILIALVPLRDRRLPTPELAFAGLLLLVSLSSVAVNARTTMSAATLSPLRSAAAALSCSQVLRIDFRTSWQQMWAIYFARERPTSVAHASDYLTGLGLRRRPAVYVHRADFEIASLHPLTLVPVSNATALHSRSQRHPRGPSSCAVNHAG